VSSSLAIASALAVLEMGAAESGKAPDPFYRCTGKGL